MQKILAFLGFVLFVCGCTTRFDVLGLADDIIDSSPDSALLLLETINPSELSESQNAHYALLYSKALYKNYIDVPNDSLISIAVNYYEKHGNEKQKFQSHLYHGCILFELSELDRSSQAYFKAESYSEAIDDPFHLGHLYNSLSFLMLTKHCNDEAEKFARLSYQNYMKIGKEPYAVSALITLSNAKIHKGQRDSCFIYIEDALIRAKKIKDTASIIDALRIKEHCAVSCDSIKLALSIIEELKAFDTYIPSFGDLAMQSYICSHYCEIDSIHKYFRWSLARAHSSIDSSFCYAFAVKSFKRIGDYERALACQDSMFHFENDLLLEALEHTTIAAQRDYVESKLLVSEIKTHRQNLVLICLGLVFCCLIVIAVLLYRGYQIKNKLQIEKIKNLQNELAKITDEQRSNIYQIQESAITASLHKKAVDGQHVTDNEWTELNSLYSTLYPLFRERLKSLHTLSDTEWKVCMLIKLGFTPSEIAELINKSLNTISSIRSRLYEKCFKQKGKPADWDHFINSL